MKNIILYTILMSFLFALLDWKVVELTRITHRKWMDWMHNHERAYALVVGTAEYFLCVPAMALKPIFYYAAVSVQASQEGQDAILHAPKPTLQGFYQLPFRGGSWTFVSWGWWILYWTPQTIVWLYAVQLLKRNNLCLP